MEANERHVRLILLPYLRRMIVLWPYLSMQNRLLLLAAADRLRMPRSYYVLSGDDSIPRIIGTPAKGDI